MAAYTTISFSDPDFESKLIRLFRSDGVVAITDVMSKEQCDKYMDGLVSIAENLDTGVDRRNCKKTWLDENLPPQTRAGLFQCAFSNSETVWKIRSDTNILKIFSVLYSDLREKKFESYNNFITSGDAINLRPNGIDTYLKKDKSSDWPHIDQTDRSDIFKCVQGQMILTNTTACLVASPKSHTLFHKILDYYEVPSGCDTNWVRIMNRGECTIDEVKKNVLSVGGSWQVPILAPAGSFLVWASSTIHSARLAVRNEQTNKYDIWAGWRGVVYVCHRPKEEWEEYEIELRQEAYKNNRTTNHWGTKIFKLNPKLGNKNGPVHMNISEIIKDPKVLYENRQIVPNLDNNCRKLLGYELSDSDSDSKEN